MGRALRSIAAASLSSLLALESMPLIFGNSVGPGVRSYPRRLYGVPANINRHTGRPHEHKREIARRLSRSNSTERTA